MDSIIMLLMQQISIQRNCYGTIAIYYRELGFITKSDAIT